MTESKTETKTTYASEHDARNAVVNALLKPNVTRVWWSYHYWEKEPGAKPYVVTIETVLREPEFTQPSGLEKLNRRIDEIEADANLYSEALSKITTDRIPAIGKGHYYQNPDTFPADSRYPEET